MLSQKVAEFLVLTNEGILNVKQHEIQTAEDEIALMAPADKSENNMVLELFKKQKVVIEKKAVLDQIAVEDEKNIALEAADIAEFNKKAKKDYCQWRSYSEFCRDKNEDIPELYNPNRTLEQILQDTLMGEYQCNAIGQHIDIIGGDNCAGVYKRYDMKIPLANGDYFTTSVRDKRNADGEWNLRANTYWGDSNRRTLRFDNLYKELSGKEVCSDEDRAVAWDYVGNMQKLLASGNVSKYLENRHCQHEMRTNEFQGLAQKADLEVATSEWITEATQYDPELSREYHELAGTQKEADASYFSMPSVEEIEVVVAEWQQMARDLKDLRTYYVDYIRSFGVESFGDHPVLYLLKDGNSADPIAQEIFNTFKPYLRADNHSESVDDHIERISSLLNTGRRWYLNKVDFANENLEIYRARKLRVDANMDYMNAVETFEEASRQMRSNWMPQDVLERRRELNINMFEHSVAEAESIECSTKKSRKALWSKTIIPEEDKTANVIYRNAIKDNFAGQPKDVRQKKIKAEMLEAKKYFMQYMEQDELCGDNEDGIDTHGTEIEEVECLESLGDWLANQSETATDIMQNCV